MTQRQDKAPSWSDEQLARMLDAIPNLNDTMQQLVRGMKTRNGTRLIGAESRRVTSPPVRTNIFPNPDLNGKGAVASAGTGGTAALTYPTDTDGTTYARVTWSVAPTAGGGIATTVIDNSSSYPAFTAPLSASAYVRPSRDLTVYAGLDYFNNGVQIPGANSSVILASANVWTLVPIVNVPEVSPSNGMRGRWYIQGAGVQVGDTFDVKNVLVESGGLGLFFDGVSAPSGYAAAWTDAPSASSSVAWALGTSQKLSVSTGRLAGWSLRELTGTVPAIARLRDGTDTGGDLLAEIVIPPGGSVTQSLHQPVGFTYGCYLDVVSGALEGAVHIGAGA